MTKEDRDKLAERVATYDRLSAVRQLAEKLRNCTKDPPKGWESGDPLNPSTLRPLSLEIKVSWGSLDSRTPAMRETVTFDVSHLPGPEGIGAMSDAAAGVLHAITRAAQDLVGLIGYKMGLMRTPTLNALVRTAPIAHPDNLPVCPECNDQRCDQRADGSFSAMCRGCIEGMAKRLNGGVLPEGWKLKAAGPVVVMPGGVEVLPDSSVTLAACKRCEAVVPVRQLRKPFIDSETLVCDPCFRALFKDTPGVDLGSDAGDRHVEPDPGIGTTCFEDEANHVANVHGRESEADEVQNGKEAVRDEGRRAAAELGAGP